MNNYLIEALFFQIFSLSFLPSFFLTKGGLRPLNPLRPLDPAMFGHRYALLFFNGAKKAQGMGTELPFIPEGPLSDLSHYHHILLI